MGGLIAGILMFFGMAADKAQKVGQLFTLAMILLVLRNILSFLFDLVKKPLFLGVIVAALTFFPDTCGWIFLKIGEIELRVMAVVLSVVMPDVFATGGAEYASWAQIWQQGLSMLPSDMVEVMNGLGVANILGMITSTISAVGMIKIYTHAMRRAGLM